MQIITPSLQALRLPYACPVPCPCSVLIPAQQVCCLSLSFQIEVNKLFSLCALYPPPTTITTLSATNFHKTKPTARNEKEEEKEEADKAVEKRLQNKPGKAPCDDHHHHLAKTATTTRTTATTTMMSRVRVNP